MTPVLSAYLADAVTVIHAGYILFVVGGQAMILLGWARGWLWTRACLFRSLHLAAIGLVVIEGWIGIYCPLTMLENYLRIQAGDPVYSSAFISRWINGVIYYSAPEWVFTLLYTVFFIIVAVTFVAYPPRCAKNNGQGGCDD